MFELFVDGYALPGFTLSGSTIKIKMEKENEEPEVNVHINDDDAADVERLLEVVIKRRKTIPTKCMEYLKQTLSNEILQLERAKVILKENKERENFNKMIHRLKKLKSFQFSLDDLHEAEKKLEKYHKRTREINSYLEKRRKYFK